MMDYTNEIDNAEIVDRGDLDKKKESISIPFDKVRTIFGDNAPKLDDDQLRAVLCEAKYEQVIAGAGTGKTFTAAAKVKYLVEKRKVPAKSILLLSLTNKAVDELVERIQKRYPELKNCRIKTFHGLGYSVVKKSGEKRGLSQRSIKRFIKDFIVKGKVGENTIEDEPRRNFLNLVYVYFSFDSNFPEWIMENIAPDMTDDNQCEEWNFSSDEWAKILKNYSGTASLIELLNRFISLMKVEGIADFDYFDDAAVARVIGDDKKAKERISVFLGIGRSCFNAYENYLEKYSQIDFSDMINKATGILKKANSEGGHCRIEKYDYIIVDEYQDISGQRFDLLKELVTYSNSKQLMVVGDDWQSIYAFAGSKVKLFRDFENMFEDSKGNFEQITINNTRRNPQSLIDIAGNFVMSNEAQIKKELSSKKEKQINNPVMKISHESYDSVWACVEALRQIKKDRENDGRPLDGDILILGRYGNSGRYLCTKPYGAEPAFIQVSEKEDEYGNVSTWLKASDESLAGLGKIVFMTVHSSKGLEADDVIILGMNDGKYGFPCKIEDDPILKLVSTMEEEECVLEYPEERRLFYVALTRSRNRVYLLGGSEMHESVFIPEIREANKGTENLKLRELQFISDEGKSYKEKEEERLAWWKDKERNHQFAEKDDDVSDSFKILNAVWEISSCNGGYSIKEETLKDFLAGNETETVSRKRKWGDSSKSLKELGSFGIFKDNSSAVMALLQKIIDKGFLFKSGFDSPFGDFVRYGKEEIHRWNNSNYDDLKELREYKISGTEEKQQPRITDGYNLDDED